MQKISGGVTVAAGFQAGGIACGIKKNGQPDLALVYSEAPAVAAGIFTTNVVQAAPVVFSKQQLRNDTAQAVILNSGNANACVPDGTATAEAMARAAADFLGIPSDAVLVASTGVIGVSLPMTKIQQTLAGRPEFISAEGGRAAAQAIMTTDTFPKEAAVEFELDGRTVHIGGMAKGSGMIHPNMATMLGVVTTDIAIDAAMLKRALRRAGDLSFNRVTVDGDTSTNDCLLILANGKAGNASLETDGPEYQLFLEGLITVCQDLARQMARDGEGATKLVEIKVTGAATESEAVTIAKSIATSNLVKTALFGEDANWGRILAAAGYSGVTFEPGRVRIYLGDLLVCENGCGLVFDEARAKRVLEQSELLITVNLGAGSAEASVWTCDLSYDYVKINGSYRT
ncbi:glutamate N-acetyltransferase [Hydrogenispora ethanolica]|jgi:glutamate N-acetyltransferase/amino-acid N-acetyltransferase|uniref:Arginine biosynthesis bifunctional protein ArgJ n=1 Tax=Hydrogenispora ethanolica TaxID=1082276 RepID=A0A4R1RFR0_HYDET|nr:bifunctional glutamate N-acetyltransferase/amino-acid acetyltransferase ArgJ [Hydrogenispora ethanolica]TCL64783.1 glutamate N-acetyltransferase [Hydrogenispora ethanolica]